MRASMLRTWVILWEEATKANRVSVDDFGIVQFTNADFPPTGDKTVWAEVFSPSSSVRDMSIDLSYRGLTDTVKATGVWATSTDSEFWTCNAQTVETKFPDMPTPPRDALERVGGTGQRPINFTRGAENAMVIQFTVQPPGIENETNIVFFDIARRTDAVRWYWKDTQLLIDPPPRDRPPLLLDAANDDPNEFDESSAPNQNRHMYSFDSPGLPAGFLPVPGGPYDSVRYVLNAWEYVRVGILTDPSGDTLSGSRASDFYVWNSTITIICVTRMETPFARQAMRKCTWAKTEYSRIRTFRLTNWCHSTC